MAFDYSSLLSSGGGGGGSGGGDSASSSAKSSSHLGFGNNGDSVAPSQTPVLAIAGLVLGVVIVIGVVAWLFLRKKGK